MNQLAVIIPVYDQWELTQACLLSLREQTRGDFFQVIVVDNGSSDATSTQCKPLLEALFPDRFLYLRQTENLGFGVACTLGAEAADAIHLFFLNNDTELTHGWADPLFKALAADPRLGAVSPLLIYPESRRVQHLGVCFDPNLHPMHLFEGFPWQHPAASKPRTLQAISAAALFMPRYIFLDCGGFHSGYRNGSEDLDLCCQLARRGLRVGCEPRSVVLHHTSRTEGRFANAGANAELLDQRCRGCFTSDLHRYARKEGFKVRLTKWLEPFLVEAQPTNWDGQVEELPALLERFPLFFEGYVPLITALEENGIVGEAFVWADLLAGFCPRMQHFARAARLAAKDSRHDRAQHWLDRLVHVQGMLGNEQRLVRRAWENRNWFRELGEDELCALYQDWLDRRTLEQVAMPLWKREDEG
ncbi:MAG: glycosyltransferase family 2 protein [Proteobacteria bacterium]|nr:glycosyltransferase family 2 protein [Pseudomonadota bacterium]MBU1612265.1 glycosyltransferase family 2 protein [Pseudomonadota bacterium]